jgi:von Willebrand factor type A domain
LFQAELFVPVPQNLGGNMKADLTQITIVLDRSGSMSTVRDATILGFNEFVDGQREAPGEANVTLIQFDTENAHEVVFDQDVKGVPKLAVETYVPRGGTPLHDALGRTITELGSKIGKMSEGDRPGKVVIVTMTDGLENSSREYTASRIAEMIKHQREVYKWEFIFLGANQDAILTGERLNIPSAQSVTYDHTRTGTGKVMASTSANVAAYRRPSASGSALHYTGSQRKSAMERDEKKPQKTPKD